jgi:hypothetical protein
VISDEKSTGDNNRVLDTGPLPKLVIPEEELKSETERMEPSEPKDTAPVTVPAKKQENEKKKSILDLW